MSKPSKPFETGHMWALFWGRRMLSAYSPVLILSHAEKHKARAAVYVEDTTLPNRISCSSVIFYIDTRGPVSSTCHAFGCHSGAGKEFNKLELLGRHSIGNKGSHGKLWKVLRSHC